ncbi:transmembrane protein 229b-like [Rhopilema esculentum]|uniref:transmembrane protein 229b-like n=1 Tax=Rhopilema esculentum TaxID=499914 RepID=UPI0031D845ED|eukprot:gene3031-1304_t
MRLKVTLMRPKTIENQGLPVMSKLIFYGLVGFFTEVVFTAVWFMVDPKYESAWTLHGYTSLWSFPMYGISIYMMENMFLHLRDWPLALRILVYVCWTYAWEFSTGVILRQFNACPWNYSDYTKYNVAGLITLDYAPLWSLATAVCEKIVIQSALSLQYIDKTKLE